MFNIPPPEFSEKVSESKSWSELARRCGHMGEYRESIGKVLKQKVAFLGVDTQHFVGKHNDEVNSNVCFLCGREGHYGSGTSCYAANQKRKWYFN